METRRQGHGTGGRRRLRRILPGARKPCAAGAAGPHARRRRRNSRDLLHRLAQRLRARAVEGGRDAARPRRLVGHRHRSDPTRQVIRRVIVTAGSAEKCDACRRLGADVAIKYKGEDFVAATKAATEGKGADVILDMVGGDYIERNYEAAAVEGRVVQIALQAGPKATVNFHRIMLKRLTHTGSTLRARSISDKGAVARAVEEHVLPLIPAGRGPPREPPPPPPPPPPPARQSSRRACAHGDERAHRQDRAVNCNSMKFFLFLLHAAARRSRPPGPCSRRGPRNRRKST